MGLTSSAHSGSWSALAWRGGVKQPKEAARREEVLLSDPQRGNNSSVSASALLGRDPGLGGGGPGRMRGRGMALRPDNIVGNLLDASNLVRLTTAARARARPPSGHAYFLLHFFLVAPPAHSGILRLARKDISTAEA